MKAEAFPARGLGRDSGGTQAGRAQIDRRDRSGERAGTLIAPRFHDPSIVRRRMSDRAPPSTRDHRERKPSLFAGARGLRRRHPAVSDQLDRLKLERARILPSFHDPPPVPC